MGAREKEDGASLLDRPLDSTRIKVDFDPAAFDMIALSLEILVPGQPCPVDLFLPLYSLQSKQTEMKPVAPKGQLFKPAWRQRLIKAEQSKVYTHQSEADTLSEYFESNAAAILDESRTSTRQRARIVRELAAVNLNALFGGDLSAKSLNTAVGRAHDTVKRLSQDMQILSNLSAVLKSDYTVYSHSINVCMLAMAWGRYLGLSESRIWALGIGGLLHDVGKAQLPRTLLERPGPLTPQEMSRMRGHPRLGYQMLLQISAVSYDALMIVLHHHENADGSGYPAGLGAQRTPYLARLVRVVDAYDAMTSKRPFQEASTPVEAASALLNQMIDQMGGDLVPSFIRFLGSSYLK